MKIKNNFTPFLLAILLLISNFTVQASNNTKDPDPEKDQILVYMLKNILTRMHFVEKELNDDLSEQIYNSFIDGLDPNKRYFTQKDMKDFSKFKYEIDNQLENDEVTFYNLVYNRFTDKIKNAKLYYGDLLAQPFNFKKEEVIDMDFEKIPFAKNENELIDYWRKQLKLNVLSRVEEKISKQEEKVKKDKNTKIKTFKTFETLTKFIKKLLISTIPKINDSMK